MRLCMMLLMVVALGLSLAQPTEARLFGRRNVSYSSTGGEGYPVAIDNEKRYHNGTLSCQDIALIRAKWLAHFEVLDHGIHGYHVNCPDWSPYASAEGIGMGGPKCATCTFGMTIVADAEWKGKSGFTYRVRLWR